MKKMLLTFVAVAMSVAVFAQGQTFEWGAKATIGQNYHYYQKGAFDGKPGVAWNAGLTGQWNFSKSFALRSGVTLGQNFAKMGSVGGDVQHLSQWGLSVPLELVWRANEGDPLYIFAGGYYSRVLGTRLGGEKYTSSMGPEVRKNEWGVRYGAGVNVSKRFAIELNGQQAISNVFESGPKMKNYVVGLSLVYKF